VTGKDLPPQRFFRGFFLSEISGMEFAFRVAMQAHFNPIPT
jgi:hypothetical protein